MTKDCRRGLDDRCRDSNGEIRHKNGATRIGTLLATYWLPSMPSWWPTAAHSSSALVG